jgi:hypothetical protein
MNLTSIQIKERLLAFEAARWKGITEVGGPNKGQIVEMFQKAVDGKAQGEPWCFTGDTEILTEDGWIRFDTLEPGVRVAQVSEGRTISFIRPTGYVRKKYSGDGWHIKTRSINLICDKNHRFYGYFNNSEVARFGTLDDCSHSLNIKFGRSESPGVSLTNENLEFLSAFLSDGFFSKTRQGNPRIRIQVSKERKIDALGRMDPIGKYTASMAYGASRIPLTTFSFEVPEWFGDLFDGYKALKWDFVNALSSEQSKIFLSSYLNFDGYTKSGSKMVFSSRKELADQLLTICLLAGYSPTMTLNISELSGRPCWCVRWSENDSKCIKKEHLHKVEINEDLFCVSVPDERIIVRGQDSSPLVVGNCMAFAQFCIAMADQCYDAIQLSSNATSPLMKTEHCLTLWQSSPILMRCEPKPGSLMLWNHWKDGAPTSSGHVGIVIGVDGDKIKTIEGNTSGGPGVVREGDGVFERTRSRLGDGDMKVLGFLSAWI